MTITLITFDKIWGIRVPQAVEDDGLDQVRGMHPARCFFAIISTWAALV